MNTYDQSPSCSCNGCKQMCKRAPCFGTPEEIRNIIDAGFIQNLIAESYPIYDGEYLKKRVLIVMPASTYGTFEGQCVFFDKDGLCKLHNLDLKPLEGRISNHEMSNGNSLQKRISVAETWDNEEGKKLVNFFLRTRTEKASKSSESKTVINRKSTVLESTFTG